MSQKAGGAGAAHDAFVTTTTDFLAEQVERLRAKVAKEKEALAGALEALAAAEAELRKEKG